MAADIVYLRLPPAHSDKGWARGVVKKNIEGMLEAICCEGRVAENEDRVTAETALVTVQSLSEIAVGIFGQELDEASVRQLKKCTACVAMRFELAHRWVGCKPTNQKLPDCSKYKAL